MTKALDLPSAYLRRRAPHKGLVLALSMVIIGPCLWHRHIEAGDLGSHVYNAWLVQLIEKGQAPGLYVVRQWNNVLVDGMLLATANLLGFGAAEKIVVAACVLVFFWGVFALIGAFAQQTPWFLIPCLAMLTYGYSFQMGFLNYYLSLGLASWSLVLLWRGKGLLRVAGGLLIPLVFFAHPLGLSWLVSLGLYLVLWTKLPRWWKLSVPIGAVGVLAGVRWYLAHRAQFPVEWTHDPFYLLNGADQLNLFGSRYAILSWVALGFGVICVALDVITRRRECGFWKSLRLPAELYLVAIFATALLPENLRPSITGGWIGLLVSRLTTITAIFGLCLLSCLKPRRVQVVGFAACALLFFTFLYQDTLVLNRMETAAEHLVNGLAFGTRVLSTIWAPPHSRISFVGHFVDRACIGHCFSYANYEPSSGQFRVRVQPGSPLVIAFDDDSEDMQAGEYEVQDEDLPAVEIFQCDAADLTKLCIRDLASGEKNGLLGYKPAAH